MQEITKVTRLDEREARMIRAFRRLPESQRLALLTSAEQLQKAATSQPGQLAPVIQIHRFQKK